MKGLRAVRHVLFLHRVYTFNSDKTIKFKQNFISFIRIYAYFQLINGFTVFTCIFPDLFANKC
jgi:hypothetical protein